jgi:two-component system C4-dicarboxylate transport response regulator DctD
MAQLATNIRMSGRFLHPMPEHLVVARHVRALVVSSELEVRKPLLRSLQWLQVDAIVCADLREAEEALAEHCVDVVFCDDRLPDGSYSDLLGPSRSRSKALRIVVTTRTGDWELYFEALGKGAFDVIQSPCYPTHVEMTITRVLREEESAVGVSQLALKARPEGL